MRLSPPPLTAQGQALRKHDSFVWLDGQCDYKYLIHTAGFSYSAGEPANRLPLLGLLLLPCSAGVLPGGLLLGL